MSLTESTPETPEETLDKSRRIFYALWIKYPKLLYVDYAKNARLLAWWLGVVEDTDREFIGQDPYSVVILADVTGCPVSQVVDDINDAIHAAKLRAKIMKERQIGESTCTPI